MKALLTRIEILLFLTLSMIITSAQANAGRDNFAPIDGQNYYEFLKVTKDVAAGKLKAVYRALMREYHPDVAGEQGVVMSQKINSAYDVLKDPEKRRRYDSWLSTGSSSNSGSRDRQAADDEEFRKKRVHSTADILVKEAAEIRRQYPNWTFDDFVNMGRAHVIYHMRFMPMASYSGKDLYEFIYSRGVRSYEGAKIDADALAMIAGGALTYLSEMALDGMSDDHKNYFERAKNMIRMYLDWDRDDLGKRQLWDGLWKITSGGKSFYPPPPPPRAANSCEASLSFTRDGVTYTVPISISIKLGR